MAIPVIILGFCSLVVLGSLIRPGYIFSYDGLYFYPRIVTKLAYLIPNQRYFLLLLETVSSILPTWLIQRLIWFFSLWLGSAGFFFFFYRRGLTPGFLAGLFFIFNPFVYERLVMGQTFIIIGFGLYAWVLITLRAYLERQRSYYLLLAGFLAGFSVMLFPHSLIILISLALIYLILRTPKEGYYRRLLFAFFTLVLVTLTLNAHWIFSSLGSENASLGKLSAGLADSDFNFYFTSDGPMDNIWINVLSLNGFWAERSDFFRHQLDSDLTRVTSAITALTLLASFVLLVFRRESKKFAYLLVCSVAAITILAIGRAHPITSEITSLIYDYLPFYRGLREPQKWVALLVLIYAFLFSYLAQSIMKTKLLWLKITATISLATLIIINSNIMIGGFNRQLTVSDFPQSWYEADILISKQNPEAKILFLPFKFYLPFSFAGREIINPSLGFFTNFVYIGNDIEAGNTYYQYYDEELQIIEKQVQLIQTGGCIDENIFRKLKISHVFLTKEGQWHPYMSLGRCPNIELVRDYSDAALFYLKP